jgi:hypothetical protein
MYIHFLSPQHVSADYSCHLLLAPQLHEIKQNRRRVDAEQNTRGTPTVNHNSGVGANEKNHGTTYITEGQLSKKFGLKIPLKMARGWRRNMSGKF